MSVYGKTVPVWCIILTLVCDGSHQGETFETFRCILKSHIFLNTSLCSNIQRQSQIPGHTSLKSEYLYRLLPIIRCKKNDNYGAGAKWLIKTKVLSQKWQSFLSRTKLHHAKMELFVIYTVDGGDNERCFLNSSHPKGFQSDVFSSLCLLGNLRISEATQFVLIILLPANVS